MGANDAPGQGLQSAAKKGIKLNFGENYGNFNFIFVPQPE
jgi:hypothetical protein